MKTKGQVASLDLLLSLVVIALIIGVSLQIIERQQNQALNDLEYTQIQTVALRASNLFTHNPDNNCWLT
ncbi:MAG: hypothetical protein GOV15_02300, partial [Candidatus Diapherotrites archaeon]|nr:hypothetical protein [Candidatus Diapherotrites archaeon]